jgi:excisionase family DNA binding protein
MENRTEPALDIALIRPAKAAKILDVSRPYVYKMISQGLLPSVQWSADGSKPTVRIKVSVLREFIEKHRRNHVY